METREHQVFSRVFKELFDRMAILLKGKLTKEIPDWMRGKYQELLDELMRASSTAQAIINASDVPDFEEPPVDTFEFPPRAALEAEEAETGAQEPSQEQQATDQPSAGEPSPSSQVTTEKPQEPSDDISADKTEQKTEEQEGATSGPATGSSEASEGDPNDPFREFGKAYGDEATYSTLMAAAAPQQGGAGRSDGGDESTESGLSKSKIPRGVTYTGASGSGSSSSDDAPVLPCAKIDSLKPYNVVVSDTKLYDVRITHIVSPSHFYVVFIDEEKNYHLLRESMRKNPMYGTMWGRRIEVGDPCTIRHPQEGFLRGIVQHCGEQATRVVLIDVGAVVNLPNKLVSKMILAHAPLPMLAVRCCISGSIENPPDAAAIERFKTTFPLSSKWKMKVYGRSATGQKPYEVDLYDFTTEVLAYSLSG